MKFHICSSDDAGLLRGVCETPEERLLSVETELGKSLLGKKLGEHVIAGDMEFRIENIEVSNFTQDRP